MEHYVTLFDAGFLPQGLALHDSLIRHAGDFTLWVLCMDEAASSELERLAPPCLRVIRIAEVEQQHPDLLTVKAQRSRAEYCWTLTPFTPALVFEREPLAARATYVDADVYLLRSPVPVFKELESSGKAVQITPHGYDPEYDQSATSGRYCVQFMSFVRGRSEPVRQWWQDRCVEWCYARVQDGKFGDQKYLDDWDQRFGDLVHVLSRQELILAPWNARRFPFSEAVAWHFHGLRLLQGQRVLLHRNYEVPPVVDQSVYLPYLGVLRQQVAKLGKPVVQAPTPSTTVEFCKALLKALRHGSGKWSRNCQVVDLK